MNMARCLQFFVNSSFDSCAFYCIKVMFCTRFTLFSGTQTLSDTFKMVIISEFRGSKLLKMAFGPFTAPSKYVTVN